MRVILCGGGPDPKRLFGGIHTLLEGVRVAYVWIAAEAPGETKLAEAIRAGEAAFKEFTMLLGATSVDYVSTAEFDTMFDAQCIIFLGGDTEHLLQVLREKDFVTKLKTSSVETLIGFSAGAIALAKGGLGTKDGEPFYYRGLGLIDAQIVVPSANVTCLAEYSVRTRLTK